MNNKIYIVSEDWEREGERGNIIHPFSSYEKAKKFYDKCIKLEKEEYFARDYIISNDVEYCKVNESWKEEDKNYVIATTDDLENNFHEWFFYEKESYDNFHSSYTLMEYELDKE